VRARKIRILMAVTTAFEPDPRVYKEARSLVRAGYDVTVCSWDRERKFPAREILDGISVLRFHQPSQLGSRFRQLPAFLGFYRFVWRNLRSGGYQVLHCHDLDTMPVGIAARAKGMPVIFDAHEPQYYAAYGAPWPALFKGLERISARFANWVLVTNALQFKKYRHWGFPRVSEIRNVPPAEFAGFRKSRGEANGALTVGRIGFIKRGVGVEELFDALASVRAEGYNVRGLLVGKIHPDIRDAFGLLLKDASYVQYAGEVRYNEVPGWYGKMDLAVALYTRIEEHRFITPTKVLEALASGVPVLANAVGDVEELAARYGGIVVLKERTSEALAQAIRELVESPAKLTALRNATKQASRELIWENMETRLLRVYSELLGATQFGKSPLDS